MFNKKIIKKTFFQNSHENFIIIINIFIKFYIEINDFF